MPASTSFGRGKGTYVGWQVTLCDPVWHASSRSGVTMLHCELLYSYTLLYFTLLWIDMTRCDLFTVCLFPWASTPLEYWGSQVERRRRDNRGAVGGEGVGLRRGCAPSQKFYEFFISEWCDMVQMKITATSGIQKFRWREKIKHLSKYWGSST